MLRWAIIGSEDAEAVAAALRATGHDLAVAVDETLTRAQAFAASQGVRRARSSVAEALDARDVDAVYVGVPTARREAVATAALDAGKHVLCARPLAVDADGAARMAAAAARTGDLVLLEAAVPRFHPRTAAVLELVRTGGIGVVRLASVTAATPLVDAASFRASPNEGGGALLGPGVDAVALLRWLLGEEPDVVRAVVRRWATGVDATTTAVLGFPSGASASVHASFDGVAAEEVVLVGTEGRLRIPGAFSARAGEPSVVLRSDAGAEAEEVLGTWSGDPFTALVDAFERATAGERPPVGIEDAVATAHVLDWIRAGAG